jgi:hypothetical protein
MGNGQFYIFSLVVAADMPGNQFVLMMDTELIGVWTLPSAGLEEKRSIIYHQ